MALDEWLQRSYGLVLPALPSLRGRALEEAFYHALVDCGLDYGQQRDILSECYLHHCDSDFGHACLDRIASIDALLQRRDALVVKPVRKCHSGVAKNKDWPTGSEYAELRFEAAAEVNADRIAGIERMVNLLVENLFVEARDGVVLDLRQGLGYYAPGEDLFRRRRTVKWIAGQNTLHFFVDALLGGRQPLIRVSAGAGCWKTAASLFVDKNSHAFTNERLEHGVVRSDAVRRQLLAFLPRR